MKINITLASQLFLHFRAFNKDYAKGGYRLRDFSSQVARRSLSFSSVSAALSPEGWTTTFPFSELDLSQKATQRSMTRGRQSSRETGFSFHEISKASRRPPGTRTGEFIKIETRHLCRELRIRRKSVPSTTHTYSSSSRRSPAKLGHREREAVRCETSPQG